MGFCSGLTVVSHPRAGRTLRVHPVRLLQHQLSQLLVERGQVLGSCGTDAGKDGSCLSRGTAEGLPASKQYRYLPVQLG